MSEEIVLIIAGALISATSINTKKAGIILIIIGLSLTIIKLVL